VASAFRAARRAHSLLAPTQQGWLTQALLGSRAARVPDDVTVQGVHTRLEELCDLPEVRCR